MARTRPAIVRGTNSAIAGQLYFQTRTHVVLLNSLVKGADLRRLRAQRDIHFEPEANITIIPKEAGMTVEIVEALNGARRGRS